MLRFAAVAALLATSLSTAQAQAYPSKPIRLMIGYTAGGSAEAGARPLARALEPLLGQPLVFEYRPGNAGGVAMEAIAKAPNDGYTLYYFDSGPLTVAPHLGKVGYDNIRSFTQLGHVCGRGEKRQDPRAGGDLAATSGRVPGCADDERARPERLRFDRVVRRARPRRLAAGGRLALDSGARQSRRGQEPARPDQRHRLRRRDPASREDAREDQGGLREMGPRGEGSEHQG